MKVCDVVLNSVWLDPRVTKQVAEYVNAGIDVVCVGMKCRRYDEEKIMNDVLELEIEDFVSNEDNYEIITSPNDFISVKEGVENMGYDSFVMSEVTYIPDNYMSLDEETVEKAVALIEALEDIDDVQAVYHNLELQLIIIFLETNMILLVSFFFCFGGKS